MSGFEKLSRREFLQTTGIASGGLVFAMTLGYPRSAAGASNVAPSVYVNIRDDDVVEIYCHRSEMGQGIRTSLPQVIADELEADWDRIELLQAPGDAKYGDQNTDGSTSIRKHFDLLRTAGASAREMLIAAAAMEWGMPAAELVARNHAIHHEASGRSAAYGDLVASAAELEVPEDVTFKDPADYRYIGKPMDLIDGVAMTTGAGIYGTDTVLPGMLYASVERCPVFGGTVKSVDDAKALKVAGVEQVVQMPDGTSPPGYNPLGGVAVLASNTWSAEQGRKALAIEWETGLNAEYDSASYRQQLVDTSHKDGKTVMNRKVQHQLRGHVDGRRHSAANGRHHPVPWRRECRLRNGGQGDRGRLLRPAPVACAHGAAGRFGDDARGWQRRDLGRYAGSAVDPGHRCRLAGHRQDAGKNQRHVAGRCLRP